MTICRYDIQCAISYEAREAQASGPLQSRGSQHESWYSIQLYSVTTLLQRKSTRFHDKKTL